MRRKHGEDDLQLLTVGLHTYSGDSRYTVEFQYPNNWRLQIKFTNKRDEGTYECQISTHPPKVIQIHLHINGEQLSETAIEQFVFGYCPLCIVAFFSIAYISEALGNYNKYLRLSNPNSQKLKKFYAVTIHLTSVMMFICVTKLSYMF